MIKVAGSQKIEFDLISNFIKQEINALNQEESFIQKFIENTEAKKRQRKMLFS